MRLRHLFDFFFKLKGVIIEIFFKLETKSKPESMSLLDDSIESSGVVQSLSKEVERFLTEYSHSGSDKTHNLRVQLIAVVSPDKFSTSLREGRSATEITTTFCDILTYKPSVTLLPSTEDRLSQFCRVTRLVFDFDFGKAFGVNGSDAYLSLDRHEDITRLVLAIVASLSVAFHGHAALFVLSRFGLHLWTNQIAFEIPAKAVSLMKRMRDCLNTATSACIDGIVADQAVLDRQEKGMVGSSDRQGVISIPCSVHRAFGGRNENETVGYVPFFSLSFSSVSQQTLASIESHVSACVHRALSCHIGYPRERETLSFLTLQEFRVNGGPILSILD